MILTNAQGWQQLPLLLRLMFLALSIGSGITHKQCDILCCVIHGLDHYQIYHCPLYAPVYNNALKMHISFNNDHCRLPQLPFGWFFAIDFSTGVAYSAIALLAVLLSLCLLLNGPFLSVRQILFSSLWITCQRLRNRVHLWRQCIQCIVWRTWPLFSYFSTLVY